MLDDTPAARAGLKPGDRVVALDSQPIPTPRDLTDRLDRTLAGAETTVEFRRGERVERRVLRTARRPPIEPVPDHPAPPRLEDAHPPLPREVAERLERLERLVKELEKGTEKPQDTAQSK